MVLRRSPELEVDEEVDMTRLPVAASTEVVIEQLPG